MIKLTRRYEVQAAHRLTEGLPDDHKCRRPHGHRYEIEIDVALTPGASLDAGYGMVLEYSEIDKRVMAVLELVDHNDLNTLSERAVMAMEQARAVSKNSTVENFAVWLLKALEHSFPSASMVVAVRIGENSRSVVEVSK